MEKLVKTETVKKIYKRVHNKELIEAFAYMMLNNISSSDIKRYKKTFPGELDYNIYQYGNIDVYYDDIYKTLYDLGLRTKAVTEYPNLEGFKGNNDIEKTYKILTRLAANYIVKNSLVSESEVY